MSHQWGATSAVQRNSIGLPFFDRLGLFSGGDLERLNAGGNKDVTGFEGHLTDSWHGRKGANADVRGGDAKAFVAFDMENGSAAFEPRSEALGVVAEKQGAIFGKNQLHSSGAERHRAFSARSKAVAFVDGCSRGSVGVVQVR